MYEMELLSRETTYYIKFSHPYMTTGKTRALTRWTFVGNVMSLLFNIDIQNCVID